MAKKTFEVEIITPFGEHFSGSVNSLTLPGTEGQMGILLNHAPMLAMLEPGVTTYEQDGTFTSIVTGSGFVEILDNHATVLVEVAESKGQVHTTANDLGDLAPDTREARLLDKARQRIHGDTDKQ